jgi:hypothetical protein
MPERSQIVTLVSILIIGFGALAFNAGWHWNEVERSGAQLFADLLPTDQIPSFPRTYRIYECGLATLYLVFGVWSIWSSRLAWFLAVLITGMYCASGAISAIHSSSLPSLFACLAAFAILFGLSTSAVQKYHDVRRFRPIYVFIVSFVVGTTMHFCAHRMLYYLFQVEFDSWGSEVMQRVREAPLVRFSSPSEMSW